MPTEFWCKNPLESAILVDQERHKRITLRWILIVS